MVSLPFFLGLSFRYCNAVTECTIGEFFFYEIQNSDYWCRKFICWRKWKIANGDVYGRFIVKKFPELEFCLEGYGEKQSLEIVNLKHLQNGR